MLLLYRGIICDIYLIKAVIVEDQGRFTLAEMNKTFTLMLFLCDCEYEKIRLKNLLILFILVHLSLTRFTSTFVATLILGTLQTL